MEWKIDRVRDRCTTCAAPFAHDVRVVSSIEIGDDRIERRDRCPACVPSPPAAGVWWETRYELPARRKKVDFARLFRIFEAWQHAPPSQAEPLLYLIALLLVRKRFLRMVDLVTENGVELLRLRRPGPTEQWYLTPAPLLRAEDLPPLRQRLEELIDGTIEEAEMPSVADGAIGADAAE
jgi:hypothetical protein